MTVKSKSGVSPAPLLVQAEPPNIAEFLEPKTAKMVDRYGASYRAMAGAYVNMGEVLFEVVETLSRHMNFLHNAVA